MAQQKEMGENVIAPGRTLLQKRERYLIKMVICCEEAQRADEMKQRSLLI
jgi:hypothetical protein